MFAITTYVQHYTGGSSLCNNRKKLMKDVQFENEELEALFTDNMIVYTENPKELIDN